MIMEPRNFANTLGAGAAACPEKYSEIEERMRRLERLDESLGMSVSSLQTHLQPVLSPVMLNKVENGGVSAPKPVLAPMCERLDALINRFERHMSMIQDLDARSVL